MDTVTIRLYYDFASTLCYVAHRVLRSVESEIADAHVELQWRPIDLTMAADWKRGDSFTDEVRSAIRQTAYTLGVDVEMPDPWLDSRAASRVALCAPSAPAEARWRSAVFDSIYQGRTWALTPALDELADELVGAQDLPGESEGHSHVEKSTREAMALGVTGVPTLLLGNWLVGGIHEGEAMVSILSGLAERYREVGSSEVN